MQQTGAQQEVLKANEYYVYDAYTKLLTDNTQVNDGIAVVDLSGIMTINSSWYYSGMKIISNTLRRLYADASIKAIVLRVDSGGGHSIAGDMIYNTIADRNKPVIAYAYMLASAAYKAVLPADVIMTAAPSTIVGSIGVMMSLPKWLLEYMKEQELEFYSKFSQNKNLWLRELKKDNDEVLIEDLTRTDEIFMARVKKHRKLKGDVEYALSGAEFVAEDAKKMNLIDSIGTLNDAIAVAAKQSFYYNNQ